MDETSGRLSEEATIPVSIIIAAYNAEPTLRATLNSVHAQSHAAWEAIVVDDGSTDRTVDIAEGFQRADPRFRLVRRPNGGESAARNTGIDHAKNDWLLFLDSDDWISPHYLERMTTTVGAAGEFDAAHCRWVRVSVDGTEVPEAYQPPEGDLFGVWASRSAFPVHACIVRKSLVEEVGRFDVELKKSSDWDLWQRIARTGAQFASVDETLSYYRIQPGSSSMDGRQLLVDGLQVLKRGHSPDPRVENPHPDHALGASPEDLLSQQYYLLAWCGGLMIGGGRDARPLVALMEGENTLALDAEAIARCIYESSPLPAGKSPAHWETLWPDVRNEVEGFLLAVEARSKSPGLGERALVLLKRMILGSSPEFASVVASWHEVETKLKARVVELQDHLEASEKRVTELSTDVAELTVQNQGMGRVVEQHKDRLQGSEKRISELDADVAELTVLNQRTNRELAVGEASVADLKARRDALEAQLLEATTPKFRILPERYSTSFRALGERVFFRLQLSRLRGERLLARLLGRRRPIRVLATACWGFPIYSQTFVYQELTQLIQAGFSVRFAFSALNRGTNLSPAFRGVWRARRRLVLSDEVSETSFAYFNDRMPDRVKELVQELCEASGLSQEEIRNHYHFKQAFAFTRLAEAWDPDYLHSYFFYEGTLFALVASSLLEIPRGVSAYADHMLDDYELKIVGLHLRQCSLIIATSERINRELSAIQPRLPESKIVVKPNGIDPRRFPVYDRPASSESVEIVSVSRITPKKGLIYLIEATALLRNRGLPVKVHLIGGVDAKETDREYDRGLRETVEREGLTGIVHFEGALAESEINEFFRRSQIFVAPYIETDGGDKDGLPTALLEAMSSGLAIVTTDAGSIPEVIDHDQHGLIVPQRNPEALAEAIACLARDSEKRRRLGGNASGRVRRELDAVSAELEFHRRLEDLMERQSADRPTPIAEFFRSPHPGLVDEENPIFELPSMTAHQDRAFLYHFAKNVYNGKGALVDLGCWLGSATISLAAGLAKNPNPNVRGSRVEAFDLFLWEEWMTARAPGLFVDQPMKPGDSFLPIFKAQLGALNDRVNINAGDLTEVTWKGGPITLLFNDASKSWSLANAIWRNFYPSCLPGRSFVVEQDFAHYSTPWIHLLHWRFRDCLEPVLFLPESTSVVFRPLRRLELDHDLDFSEFSEAEIGQAFERSMSLVEEEVRPNIWAARVMLELHRNELHRAWELYEEGVDRGFQGLEMIDVRQALDHAQRDADNEPWWLRVAPPGRASLRVVPGGPARVEIADVGDRVSNDIQLNARLSAVKAGQRYCVRFEAKADQPRAVFVGVAHDGDSWDGLGCFFEADLTAEWKLIEREFKARESAAVARVHFDLGADSGPVEVTDIELLPS